jgi:AraC-like DNA-binding protein
MIDGRDHNSQSNLDDSLWEFVVGHPSDQIKPWVYTYSGYREDVGQSICRLEVCRDRVVVILGFGDRFQINAVGSKADSLKCRAFVVGLGATPLMIEHDGVQRCIEIELLPWMANVLFHGASVELAQGVVDLEAIWGNQINLLLEQLSQMSSWRYRFALVEQFLAQRLAESNQIVHSDIQWAWEQLDRHGGCIPIQQLAKTLGWSDRYFGTRFREQIGITPKAAARRIRFNRVQQLLTTSNLMLSEISEICGYSDQSHFTREFHAFAGCSPKMYRKAYFPDLPGIPGNIIQ